MCINIKYEHTNSDKDGETYVGVEVSRFARLLVDVRYPDVLRLPAVDHHVPRVAVQPVSPVVVALEHRKEGNGLFNDALNTFY